MEKCLIKCSSCKWKFFTKKVILTKPEIEAQKTKLGAELKNFVKYSKDLEKKSEVKIRQLLMYYASAYHQWRFGNIDDSEWNVMLDELCNFLNYVRVKEYWKKRIADNKLWNKDFRKRGDECLRQKGGENEKS